MRARCRMGISDGSHSLTQRSPVRAAMRSKLLHVALDVLVALQRESLVGHEGGVEVVVDHAAAQRQRRAEVVLGVVKPSAIDMTMASPASGVSGRGAWILSQSQ